MEFHGGEYRSYERETAPERVSFKITSLAANSRGDASRIVFHQTQLADASEQNQRWKGDSPCAPGATEPTEYAAPTAPDALSWPRGERLQPGLERVHPRIPDGR
jgi:hypothetical protein